MQIQFAVSTEQTFTKKNTADKGLFQRLMIKAFFKTRLEIEPKYVKELRCARLLSRPDSRSHIISI